MSCRGKRLDELDAAGTLVVRDAVAAPLDELVGQLRRRRRRPACELDRGDDDLAPLVVGHADDTGVADRRVPEQHRLDLGRIDVHAAADDEVGAAVGEEEVAVLVDVADVAEREVVAAGRRRRSSRAPCSTRTRLAAGAFRYTVPIVPRRDLVAVVVEDADVVGRVDLADRARLRQPLVRDRPSVPAPSVAA